MRLSAPTFNLFRRPALPATTMLMSRPGGPEVRPPSLRHAPSSWWERTMFWLFAPAPQDASPPLNRLPRVQEEFLGALDDLFGEAVMRLKMRIGHARSLRELWHMRLDVYNEIALGRSEHEAAVRLARLNRHFPTRAPRSGFVPLEA